MKTNFSLELLSPGILGIVLLCLGSLASAATNKSFSTPEEAVKALGKAVTTTNRAALTELFGEASDTLSNPDPVQGDRELAAFAAAFASTNRLVPESDTMMFLEVGPEGWPLPIPLVKDSGRWHFDTPAGLEEIMNRRIGRNELEVLSVMRAYVEAQREYASRDRDGDDVLEYAQKIASSIGLTDGLYWPPQLNGEVSPLGPFVAQAQAEGYVDVASTDVPKPQAFHGYLFKMLKRQGKHAPGGRYDYIINGNMIGGFALAAWPLEYGESGVMTFIVNQRGRVYQKDLGLDTAKTVQKMDAYDPDPEWRISAD